MSKLKTGDMFVKSITVNGKEAHMGADLFYDIDDTNGQIILKTQIGKEKIQELIIVLTRDNTRTAVIEEIPAKKENKSKTKKSKVDEKKTSTD